VTLRAYLVMAELLGSCRGAKHPDRATQAEGSIELLLVALAQRIRERLDEALVAFGVWDVLRHQVRELGLGETDEAEDEAAQVFADLTV
jgi:hypothetical protein